MEVRKRGGQKVNYDILATGSAGNCAIINNIIAIDMGISFKALHNHFRSLKLVLLTHIHS